MLITKYLVFTPKKGNINGEMAFDWVFVGMGLDKNKSS